MSAVSASVAVKGLPTSVFRALFSAMERVVTSPAVNAGTSLAAVLLVTAWPVSAAAGFSAVSRIGFASVPVGTV